MFYSSYLWVSNLRNFFFNIRCYKQVILLALVSIFFEGNEFQGVFFEEVSLVFKGKNRMLTFWNFVVFCIFVIKCDLIIILVKDIEK